MRKLIVNTDGGARGNPGPAAAGVVVKENGATLLTLKQYLGEKQTNNWAEYEAVAIALTHLKSNGYAGSELEIRMDSMLVVEQVSGKWKIKEPTLKPQVAKVKELLAAFPKYAFVYVPRAENAEADALVNEALDEHL